MEPDWVERAKRGEPAAVAQLYRQYWRAARAVAYGVTRDLSLAEDAASEAFWTAMDSLASLRDPQRFGPWLRTIVLRTARRIKAASSAPKSIVPEALSDAEAAAPGERLEQQELAAMIREAVGSLPAILREVISLYYFEGYSVEDAARFLGVPVGTLKRRLHDGRQRLQAAAIRIAKGKKPMSPEREHVLQRLQDLIDKGGDSDAVHQVIREALELRPVPQDLLRKLMRQQFAAARDAIPAQVRAERERLVRDYWDEFVRPSARATDPRHPVGAVAAALLAVMPEFEDRTADAYLDFETASRRLEEQTAEPAPLPPGFTEGRPVSYVRRVRGLLIQDQDGSVYTQFDLIRLKSSRQDFETTWREGFRISDVLLLSWLRARPLELREVESFLRRLADAVVPGLPVSFASYEEPHYRSALRMQLGNVRIPAATGGILNPWPGVPEDMEIASARIYLEAWATARSGQRIELAELPFPLVER